MRKFKSKAQAERLRSQLLVAAGAVQPFDPATGLPAEWVRVDLLFFEWAQQWLELKWPTWACNSRRARVEVLVAFTPHLVYPDAPAPPLAVNRLDIATVPSAAEVAALVELVTSAGGDARYAAMFELMGMAGLRPSEVAGLQPGDLRLPVTGWGLVRLGRATASPGERYTNVDGSFETKDLKHRSIGEFFERYRCHQGRLPGLVRTWSDSRPSMGECSPTRLVGRLPRPATRGSSKLFEMSSGPRVR